MLKNSAPFCKLGLGVLSRNLHPSHRSRPVTISLDDVVLAAIVEGLIPRSRRTVLSTRPVPLVFRFFGFELVHFFTFLTALTQ